MSTTIQAGASDRAAWVSRASSKGVCNAKFRLDEEIRLPIYTFRIPRLPIQVIGTLQFHP